MPSTALRLFSVCGLVLWLAAMPAAAHESSDETLAQLDRALSVAPGDAELWRRRAALERSHGNLERSRADLDRACALGLAPALAERERGASARAEGRLAEAERHLRRARKLAPGDTETLVLHAETLASLGRWREAGSGYARVIAMAPGAGPDIHLARVRALAAGGDATLAEAFRALEEADAKLGPVPALAQEGLALELRAGRTDASLARLDRLSAPERRGERWMVQRAEILERAGRKEQAVAGYSTALASLEAMPPARRAAPAAVQMADRARAGLERLGATARAESR